MPALSVSALVRRTALLLLLLLVAAGLGTTATAATAQAAPELVVTTPGTTAEPAATQTPDEGGSADARGPLGRLLVGAVVVAAMLGVAGGTGLYLTRDGRTPEG